MARRQMVGWRPGTPSVCMGPAVRAGSLSAGAMRAVAGLLLAGVLWPLPAHAHAVLDRALPAPGGSVGTPPAEAVLVFSEPIDARFSAVVVRDARGAQVSGPAHAGDDGKTLIAPLQPLPTGIFTVRWRVLSAVDGHVTSGVYAFGVGETPTPDSGAAQPRPELDRVLARWLALAAALVLAGAVYARLLVFEPAARTLASPVGDLLRARLRAVTRAAGGGVAVVLAADLLHQAHVVAAQTGAGAAFLWDSRTGQAALLGIVAALATSVLAGRPRGPSAPSPGGLPSVAPSRGGLPPVQASSGGSPPVAPSPGGLPSGGLASGVFSLQAGPRLHAPRFRGREVLTAATASLVLLTFTLTAHAPPAGPLAVAADWLHLAGAAAWLGGLAALVLAVRGLDDAVRADLARVVVRPVSRLAAAGLLVTAGTGLYAAWLQVPALRALVTTTYGLALHVKLLLLLPLLAFAAVNRFLLRPQLERHAHAGLARRFVRSVAGEVGVATAIVLAAGVLTTTPPARSPYGAGARTAVLLVGLAGETKVQLVVDPARPGRNRYEVTLDASRDSGQDARVLLRFVKLDEDLTPTAVVLSPAGGGRFEAQGGHLGAAGWWEVEVVLRRRGAPDVSTFFALDLGNGLPAQRDPEALRLLQEAREAPLGTWREWEQVTDGAGSLVITQYRLAPPDRLHLRSRYELAATGAAGQTEVVVIADQRYERRDGGPWVRTTLRQPVIAEGHRVYLKLAEHVALGREGRCDDEPCRVVLWTNPGGSPTFAAWIGQRTLRVHRLYMRAPAHYMTVRPSPPEAGVVITAPR
jgi:copper transport protein